MSENPGSVVWTAATRTMRGAARVVVTYDVSVPGYEAHEEMTGTADFDADRCALQRLMSADQGGAIICDGPMVYLSQPEGCWAWTRGAPGSHSLFDPRWALEALVHAQKSAAVTNERLVEVQLDHAALDAGTDIGLSAEWDQSTAVVELTADGRIADATVSHRSREDAAAWMRYDYRLSESLSSPTIEPPAPRLRISLQDYNARFGDVPDT